MSTAAKVELVEQARGEFGVTAALRALSLPRSTWYYQGQRISYEAKHAALRRPLLAIAERYPEYGYRRATTELAEKIGEPINRKVVQKLQRALGLTVLRGKEAPPASGIRRVITEAGGLANLVARLDEIEAFEVLYTDFTELEYARGKAWLIPIVDDVTKVVAGWALGETNDTDLALEAWTNAKRALARLGVSLAGCIVHHDRDSVFTSHRWVRQLLLRDGVRISYALHGAKDNPAMESFNSRFKNENGALFADAESLDELLALVRERMRHYNRRRRHSALGNVAPMDYVRSLTRKG
jgi:putative transposase